MTRLHAQRGLTLVELLLALAITAVLMVPLATVFRTAARSGVAVRAALDLNRDARFALDRIARSAASVTAAPAGPGADVADAAAWLAPATYTLDKNHNLVETIPAPPPGSTTIIASNVTAFALSLPGSGSGWPLLTIALTLEAEGSTVRASRTVRIGGAP